MATRRVKKAVTKGAPEKGSPSSPSKKPKLSDRAKVMKKHLKGFSSKDIWENVQRPITVKTRITSLNRALGIGGFTCGMIGVLHGPSQGGKSLLLSELIAAALATGGWGLFIDAEARAVDLKWYSCIVGDLSTAFYSRPETFEDCIAKIEEYRQGFRSAKEAGDVPQGAILLIGVDSINRLIPRNELKEIMDGKVEARGYPLRALLTSKWLDKLVPTLKPDESFVLIQRESTRMDAMPGQRTWKVKGGVSIGYDAGWTCRVDSSNNVKSEDGSKKIGEKHEVTVMKNSMGPKVDGSAYFYSSAGLDGEPLGLDFVREIREEAIFRGILKYKGGQGYLYHGESVAPSKKALPKWLAEVDDDGVPNWSKIGEELDSEFQNSGNKSGKA